MKDGNGQKRQKERRSEETPQSEVEAIRKSMVKKLGKMEG